MIYQITEIRSSGIIYVYKQNSIMYPDGSEIKADNDLNEALKQMEEDKKEGFIKDFRVSYKY